MLAVSIKLCYPKILSFRYTRRLEFLMALGKTRDLSKSTNALVGKKDATVDGKGQDHGIKYI